jgi:para-aminobenzoate synthetase/4-amino-4-deoxychorismate lyase
LRDDLAASEKERAENLMIVDLMRNDLSRVAAEGSVRVANPFAVETYPTVHQMVTDVEARLKPGSAALDVIRALFPCGSITGAPKLRAMELIAEVEHFPRGPYCGAIGRWEANGDMAWNVAIRTLRLTPVENGRGTAVLGVGSAILADSDAARNGASAW